MNTANLTYKNLIAKLAGRASRAVGNNTRLTRHQDGRVTLTLHATPILTAMPDGSVRVTSGGFRTATTKARLNEWLKDDYAVAQVGGVWYWHKYATEAPDGLTRAPFKSVVFADGDSIGPRGALRSTAPRDAEAQARKLAKQINAYAKQCAAAVPLPEPGPGDCFLCAVARIEEGKGGSWQSGRAPHVVSLGDASGDTGHLREHMREGYVVPRLVHSALQESGAGDLIVATVFGRYGAGTSWQETARDYVLRAVRRYLKRRLNLAGTR